VGDYTVTLAVSDMSGNLDNHTVNVSVIVDGEAPSISHSAVPTIQEIGGIVNVTATVTDNAEVFGVWVQILDPGGNDLGNSTMPRIGLTDDYWLDNGYSILGAYTYVIWANDTSDNWAKASGSFSIQDNTSPVADAGNDRSVVQGDTVYFDGGGSTDNVGIVNYTWIISENGNPIMTLYGINTSFVFDKAGTYSVTLTVGDTSGNTDIDSIAVAVTSSGEVGEFPWWIILLLVIILVIILIIFILKKKRKKGKTETDLTESEGLASQETEVEEVESD
jgi:chitodextrinase